MNTMSKQFLVFSLLLIIGGILVTPVSAATTQVHVVRYANDNTTILAEQTLTWQQMRDTLPVLGDGVTHYYHQGPVFVDDPTNETHEQELRWNATEDTNVLEKDMGAVKGTNLKDLTDLVGGMSPGEEVRSWPLMDGIKGSPIKMCMNIPVVKVRLGSPGTRMACIPIAVIPMVCGWSGLLMTLLTSRAGWNWSPCLWKLGLARSGRPAVLVLLHLRE